MDSIKLESALSVLEDLRGQLKAANERAILLSGAVQGIETLIAETTKDSAAEAESILSVTQNAQQAKLKVKK